MPGLESVAIDAVSTPEEHVFAKRTILRPRPASPHELMVGSAAELHVVLGSAGGVNDGDEGVGVHPQPPIEGEPLLPRAPSFPVREVISLDTSRSGGRAERTWHGGQAFIVSSTQAGAREANEQDRYKADVASWHGGDALFSTAVRPTSITAEPDSRQIDHLRRLSSQLGLSPMQRRRTAPMAGLVELAPPEGQPLVEENRPY